MKRDIKKSKKIKKERLIVMVIYSLEHKKRSEIKKTNGYKTRQVLNHMIIIEDRTSFIGIYKLLKFLSNPCNFIIIATQKHTVNIFVSVLQNITSSHCERPGVKKKGSQTYHAGCDVSE